MGALRERMAVDLRLRGLSPVTQRLYLRCAERFVAYHRRSPRALGESEIRAFLDHLVQEKRVSRSTHGVYVAAIHFLYRVTLELRHSSRPPPRLPARRRLGGASFLLRQSRSPAPRRVPDRVDEYPSLLVSDHVIDVVTRPRHEDAPHARDA